MASERILCNFVLILLGELCTGQNLMQLYPRGSRQLCIRKMFHSILTAYAILVLCNVVTETPSNISQENIQTIEGMSFEQYLVTSFIYVNIRSFTSKKHKVISSSTFYQATGQTFIRTLSKKEKHFRQPCNAAETCAILTRGFRKVSGPRLHKQLTLNATIKPC